MQKRRIPLYDILFILSAAALLPFFLWKCSFGYGGGDEPFYLTLAQRLSKGDALLCDEWNLSQLSGFLLLPFYKIHQLITGTTEGIVLHFRYIYTAAQFIAALILYVRLRRFRYGALAAALIFLVYTPYDIMALSYNTMALMSVTLCLTFLATAGETDRVSYIAAGLLYAFAVLSNPFIILLYLLYLGAFIVWRLMAAVLSSKKKKSGSPSRFSRFFRAKYLLLFTLGAAAAALIFLIFLLSRAAVSDISRNLRAILDDPEHASRGFKEVIYSFFHVMKNTFGSFLAVWFLLFVLAMTDRRKKTHAWMYFCMTALICAIAVMIHIPSIQSDFNYIMFPVTMCGLTAFALTKNKHYRVFLCLWCFGMLYTFFLSWASNQGDNSICAGMPAAAVGSVILIYEFVRESLAQISVSIGIHVSGNAASTTDAHLPGNAAATPKVHAPDRSSVQTAAVSSRTARFTAPLILCVSLLFFLAQIGTECYAKAVHAFWEPSVLELDTRITDGPLAGVLTTKEHAAEYNRLLADIERYREPAEESVLFLTSNPWCYLYADRPYGTYSSWITVLSAGENSDAEKILLSRLTDYYRLHPQKYPSDIYIAKNDLITFSVTEQASSHPEGYSLAAFLLTFADADLPPVLPADDPAWNIFYGVRETADGYHLTKIIP